MPRYFLEVAYKGTNYSGFQVQENANTIQAEIEKAFQTIQREPVELTGSSRTDAGVHALQNYFHFDHNTDIPPQLVYKMNAILPKDIVVKGLRQVEDDAHSRFDAVSREYEYHIYREKNPFLQEVALYYPYKLNMELLQEAAAIIKEQTDFFAFAKTNTQVKNFNCKILVSEWREERGEIIYTIKANRFLRGMVRLVVATQLKVGRGQLGMEGLRELFKGDGRKCGYSVAAEGLFLKGVEY